MKVLTDTHSLVWALSDPGSLSVEARNVLNESLGSLPEIHRDPFDRILVAQSMVEKAPLVTKDAHLAQYGISIIW